MRLMRVFLAVLVFVATLVLESYGGGGDRRGSPEEEALSGFFDAVGGYYRVPQTELVIIRKRGIPVYEIPVVLLVAKRAHVAPDVITDFRLRDNPWLYSTLRFGLGPEIFYVPVTVAVKDPLYAKAFGHHKHKPEKEWKTIVPSDDDIINLANLKLMSAQRIST